MATKEDEVITIEHVAKPQPFLNEDKYPQEELLTTTADIDSLIKAVQADERGNIEKIIITEDIFKKIKESLIATVQSMEKNPSLFSRAAEFWGQLPLWQKIVGGVTITVPTLILGIVANIGFLLAICGVTTIAYAGGGIILQDHHNHNVSITESLTKGILGLADLLELTINALDNIRQKLTDEVQKFSAENLKLQEHNLQLGVQLEKLGKEIQVAAQLSISLKKTKEELEEATLGLREQIAEQSDLLHINQAELKKVTEEYHSSQITLSEKISEFAKIKTELELELEKTQKVAATLQATVSQLADTVIVDKQYQQEFKERLEQFFQDKEQSFDSIVGRFGESEKKLALTEEKLKQCNEEYQAHIKEMRLQIERLTKLADRRQEQVESIKSVRRTEGFFPMPSKARCSSMENLQAADNQQVPTPVLILN